MPCETGCLCDTCCKEAQAFAYGHWNLQQFEDYASIVSYNQEWSRLEDGAARKIHRQAA